jgi:large subunit ribosomal protein L19
MDPAAILRAATQPKRVVPVLRPGQTVRVHSKIIEGKKERIQIFEGLVIGVRGSGAGKTFTVRKVSFGVGVERVWPIFSPQIVKIEVVRQAKVRRAKLNFIRGLTKKQSRLREKFAEVAMEGEEEETVEEAAEEENSEPVAEESSPAAAEEKADEPATEDPTPEKRPEEKVDKPATEKPVEDSAAEEKSEEKEGAS